MITSKPKQKNDLDWRINDGTELSLITESKSSNQEQLLDAFEYKWFPNSETIKS